MIILLENSTLISAFENERSTWSKSNRVNACFVLPGLVQNGLPTLRQNGLPTLRQNGLPSLKENRLSSLEEKGLPGYDRMSTYSWSSTFSL